jgi:hypothetical protein
MARAIWALSTAQGLPEAMIDCSCSRITISLAQLKQL